jgi:hypothetical protein
MPVMSDSQLAKLGQQVTSRDSAIARLRDQLKSKSTQDGAVLLATAGAGAAAFGFLRGKLEDKASGAWNVPGTQIDWEAVAVLAVGALALGGGMISKDLKKLEGPASHVAAGILGHYVGQLARKMGHTGKFSLVAGGYGMLPSAGAGEQSISYRQTQFGPPFADPIASALAESGV